MDTRRADPYRLLLYEPIHTGHHLPYLARMLPALLDPRVKITLATTPAAIASDEFKQTLSPFADRINIEAICTTPPRNPRKNAAHRLRELLFCARTLKPDHIMVLYADGLWQPLTLRSLLSNKPIDPSIAIELFLYRGGFTYSDASRPIDRLSRFLFKHAVRKNLFAVLHLDDEILHAYALSLARPDTGPRCILTPNPVKILDAVDANTARKQLNMPASGRYIVAMGMMTPLKGMDLLIDAFLEHAGAHPDDRLLLAGPHAEEIKSILNRTAIAKLVESQQIICLDRFLSEDDMFICSAAADLVVAPYPNHSGRSSIILWAAAAQRPSLGVNRGCISHVIKRQKLGWTCDVKNAAVFAGALGKALDEPWTLEDAYRVREYAKTHSIENYKKSACQLLRSKLNKIDPPPPPPPPPHTPTSPLPITTLKIARRRRPSPRGY